MTIRPTFEATASGYTTSLRARNSIVPVPRPVEVGVERRRQDQNPGDHAGEKVPTGARLHSAHGAALTRWVLAGWRSVLLVVLAKPAGCAGTKSLPERARSISGHEV